MQSYAASERKTMLPRGQSDSAYLGAKFRRLRVRLSAPKAITTMAHLSISVSIIIRE